MSLLLLFGGSSSSTQAFGGGGSDSGVIQPRRLLQYASIVGPVLVAAAVTASTVVAETDYAVALPAKTTQYTELTAPVFVPPVSTPTVTGAGRTSGVIPRPTQLQYSAVTGPVSVPVTAAVPTFFDAVYPDSISRKFSEAPYTPVEPIFGVELVIYPLSWSAIYPDVVAREKVPAANQTYLFEPVTVPAAAADTTTVAETDYAVPLRAKQFQYTELTTPIFVPAVVAPPTFFDMAVYPDTVPKRKPNQPTTYTAEPLFGVPAPIYPLSWTGVYPDNPTVRERQAAISTITGPVYTPAATATVTAVGTDTGVVRRPRSIQYQALTGPVKVPAGGGGGVTSATASASGVGAANGVGEQVLPNFTPVIIADYPNRPYPRAVYTPAEPIFGVELTIYPLSWSGIYPDAVVREPSQRATGALVTKPVSVIIPTFFEPELPTLPVRSKPRYATTSIIVEPVLVTVSSSGVGSANGTGTANAVGVRIVAAVASASGASTTTFQGAKIAAIVGTTAGASNASGVGASIAAGVGNAQGQAFVSGTNAAGGAGRGRMLLTGVG